VGGEAKDPREREGKDRCVLLLGKSHHGRAEAVDTLTMISHGVEISIAGGGADEKDEGGRRGRRGPYIDFADAVHFDDCESNGLYKQGM